MARLRRTAVASSRDDFPATHTSTGINKRDASRGISLCFLVCFSSVLALVGTGLALAGFARVRDRRLCERSRFVGVQEPAAAEGRLVRFCFYSMWSVFLVFTLFLVGVAALVSAPQSAQSRQVYWLVSVACQLSVLGLMAVSQLFDAKNRESELYAKILELKRKALGAGEE